jgi:proprotein convertase subtilisin/kexin type 5
MGHLNMLSFQQEISLMEFFVDSEYVAKLIGYCKEPVCLLMKYYPLGSLENWTESNKLFVKESRRCKLVICCDIAQGILVLHSRQVAHCDLKPQNILVEKQRTRPRFLLTDFGISKILTEEYLASEAFEIRNIRGLTVSYAAPDVMIRFRKKLTGSPKEEKAGDIYSFGVILFFLLTLFDPWQE